MPIEYSQRERSFELYRKGKRETWDPDDYGYEQDREDWTAFTDTEKKVFLATASGFYEGEEDVTRTLAPYMVALDALDDDLVPFDTVQEEIYISQHVYEEAKHTDFFSRFYEEVVGTHDTERYVQRETDRYQTADLYEQADGLLAAVRAGDQKHLRDTLAMAYLNYMGIIEGQRARAGYMLFDQMCQSKAIELGRDEVLPGFQGALAQTRHDESRHIENGRWVLQQLAEADPDIATDVYEPRMLEYLEVGTVSDNPLFEEMPFSEYDEEAIGRKSILHLQDTIDYIGAEKFDRLTDVESTVEELREQSDTAAADDD